MGDYAISRNDRTRTTVIASAASFTSITPTVRSTEPALGDACFITRRSTEESACFSAVAFSFFGTPTANLESAIEFYGWNQNDDGKWHPHFLAYVAFNLGSDAGVSGQVPSNTQTWASTVVANAPAIAMNPVLHGPSVVYVPTHGLPRISMTVDVQSTSLGWVRTLCGFPFDGL